MWAVVPGYERMKVSSWYLAVPSQLEQFDEDAVSLQWALEEPVTLLPSADGNAA
jgi:hypothetical protein